MTTLSVLNPSGNLDVTTSDAMRRDITAEVEKGNEVLLINLEEVSFIDSSGLSALIMGLKLMRETGGRMVLCQINEQAQMLFRLTGMDTIFESFATRAEFEASLA